MRDVGRGVGVASDEVERLNDALAALSPRYGATFVDLWPELADTTGALAAKHTWDGVHLSGAGYVGWARVLANQLL